MKTGKLSDAVYGRSVRKKLKKLPETILHGAAGDDCAMFSLGDSSIAGGTAVITKQILYGGAHCGRYGVYAACNQAAVSGILVSAVLLSLMLPKEAPESLLQQIVEDAQKAGEECGVPVADVNASVTELVTRPVVTVTALGTAAVGMAVGRTAAEMASAGAAGMGTAASAKGDKKKVRPGMDVVMTKWAGLEGSAILADVCRENLLTRYPAYLVDDAAEFDKWFSVSADMQVILEAQQTYGLEIGSICAAGESGIFRALWTLAAQAGAGVEVQLKKIPIRQETVEICNHLDLNPYELVSGGSLLLIAAQGEALVQELNKAGIAAAVIGNVTDNNDRVIVNGEERRFLEPAKADEIFKVTEQTGC